MPEKHNTLLSSDIAQHKIDFTSFFFVSPTSNGLIATAIRRSSSRGDRASQMSVPTTTVSVCGIAVDGWIRQGILSIRYQE